MKIKGGVLSLIITILIVGMLILSGPVQAVTMSISSKKDVYTLNKEVMLDLEINIQDNERLPVQNLTLHITHDNIEVKTCTFYLNGSSISGCEDIEIETIASGKSPEFGYGYNFGYGYGFDGTSFETKNVTFGFGDGYGNEKDHGKIKEGKFQYKVKWDLKNEDDLDFGIYYANLEAFASLNDKAFSYFPKDKASFIIGEHKHEGKPSSGELSFLGSGIEEILDKINGLDDSWLINVTLFGDEIPNKWGINVPGQDKVKNTFNYFEINVDNETNGGLYTIFFKVSKNDLEELGINANDVRLYVHENDAWTELPTSIVDSSSNPVEFKAQVSHFSSFLIGEKAQTASSTTTSTAASSGSGGGNKKTIQNPKTTLIEVPLVYPDCKTDSNCGKGEKCKYTPEKYYKQCVIEKTQQESKRLTATAPETTTQVTTPTEQTTKKDDKEGGRITLFVILDVLKKDPRTGIFLTITVLVLTILSYFYLR